MASQRINGTHGARHNTNYLYSLYAIVCGLCLIIAMPALAAPSTQAKSKINPPPSTELQYTVHAQYNGMNIGGSASLRWEVTGTKYTLNTETTAGLLGKILSSSSTGNIGTYDLLPNQFTEKRFRRGAATTTFNRANKKIEFSESQQSIPLNGDEQDRASVVWQLISMARATPERFKPDAEFKITVTGRKGAEPWVFKVMPKSTIETGLGKLNAVHLVRIKGNGQRNEVWLAPSLNWSPVRLVISEKENFRIEQTLQKMTPALAK